MSIYLGTQKLSMSGLQSAYLGSQKVWSKSRLPSGYQEVEYIENTGTQRITVDGTNYWNTSGQYTTLVISTTHNIIPCYRESDGEIGGYDTVTSTFYSNQGTGDFAAGDIVDATALIPTMTSNTSPSGVCSNIPRTATTKTAPYLAFDGDSSTYAFNQSSTTLPRGHQYQFAESVIANRLYINYASPHGGAGTFTLKLQASADGTTWTDVVTTTTASITSAYRYSYIASFTDTTFTYARLIISATTHTSSVVSIKLYTMQLYKK